MFVVCLAIISPHSPADKIYPIPLLPPPARLLQPPDQEVIAGEITRNIITWSPVEKAALYHLEISTDPSFVLLLLDAYPADPSYLIQDLPEGTFYWHISTINAVGLEGRFNPAFSFYYPRQTE